MLVLSLLLSLVGCQCAPTEGVREVTDVEYACLDATDHVRAGFAGCLSTTCDEELRASCSARLEGDAVVVKGSAVLRHVGEACTEDCGTALATCEGPPLADALGKPINASKTPKLTRCWQ